MEYIEIKAEVFKVIRAFDGRSPKKLVALLKEHLGDDYDIKVISQCLEELLEE